MIQFRRAKLIKLLVLMQFCFPCSAVIDFEKEVWPILKQRCVECHRAPYVQAGQQKNPKAGLRLDGAAHIMHGSDEGLVIKVDHPSQSSLYTRLILPFDDEEHMPPKGDPLTDRQKEIIRKWIAQGVDFGSWVGATDGVDKLSEKRLKKDQYVPSHLLFYQELANNLAPLSEKVLQDLNDNTDLLIRPIGIGSKLLEARVVSSGIQLDQKTIEDLLPLKNHLTSLDLTGADLSIEASNLIAKFHLLTHLNLRKSTFADEGLQSLKKLKNLQNLNLTETKVSDMGVESLLSFKSLKSLHLWKSEISPSKRLYLREKLKGVNITP